MFGLTGYNSNVFTLNLNSFVINNLSVSLGYFATDVGAKNIIFGSGWANAHTDDIDFTRQKPINVYYTDPNFLDWNLGNMNYWNTWRGTGNTTFIEGLPG